MPGQRIPLNVPALDDAGVPGMLSLSDFYDFRMLSWSVATAESEYFRSCFDGPFLMLDQISRLWCKKFLVHKTWQAGTVEYSGYAGTIDLEGVG